MRNIRGRVVQPGGRALSIASLVLMINQTLKYGIIINTFNVKHKLCRCAPPSDYKLEPISGVIRNTFISRSLTACRLSKRRL